VVFGLLSSSQVMSYPLFSAMTKPMVNCSETEREKDTHTHTHTHIFWVSCDDQRLEVRDVSVMLR